MSEQAALESLLARLSYQATVRAGEAANRVPVILVAKIALILSILVSNSMDYRKERENNNPLGKFHVLFSMFVPMFVLVVPSQLHFPSGTFPY